MRDDLRSAFRSLRTSRSFTLVAVVVLALGIGATTAIFAVVDSVVLRSLPFDTPGALVVVGERSARAPARPGVDPLSVGLFQPQNYLDVAAEQQAFDAFAAVFSTSTTLGGAEADAESVGLQKVTSGFFPVFRVQPILGRTLAPDDEIDGRNRVCVLSEALWRRRFAADPSIVGKTVSLADGAFTVIGVVGASFTNPMSLEDAIDVWVPYVPTPAERVRHSDSRTWTVLGVGRLKSGVSLAAARTDLDRVATAMRTANPTWNKDVLVGAQALRDYLVDGQTTEWMLLLLGAVTLVLAIACANVANLLLARATQREREVAVRAALGASRWRIVRQLLVESLMLSAAGAAAAMVVTVWGVAVLRRAIPATIPHVGRIGVDPRVFGAAAVLALITGLLFGVAPAIQASRADVARALGDHGRGGTTSRRRGRFGGSLVVVEVALAMMLLVGASLFIGSFRTVMSIDLGFEPAGVLTVRLAPPAGPSSGTASNVAASVANLIEALDRSPGVVHAAFIAGGTPVVGRGFGVMMMPGTPRFGLRRVTPEYFASLSIPVRRGRAFSAEDRAGGALAAILDESAARAFFPGRDAIDQTVPLDGGRRVVGVVGDVHETGPEHGASNTVYVPLAQSPAQAGDLLVQAAGDPYAIVPTVKAAARQMMPGSPVLSVESMSDGVERYVALRRFNMMLLGLLGGLGLMIAGVGIYGLLAYLVAQREREIGVRMALGATRDSVVRLVLGRTVTLVAVGLALGGFGAWALGGTAKAFLFRMNTADPRVYAAALAAVVLAAAAATVIPARRAASVDPLVSLRAD